MNPTRAAWARAGDAVAMLRAAGTGGAPPASLVLAACRCARAMLVHVPEGEDRPRRAVDAAEAWARTGISVPRHVIEAAKHAYVDHADDDVAVSGAIAAAYYAASATDNDPAQAVVNSMIYATNAPVPRFAYNDLFGESAWKAEVTLRNVVHREALRHMAAIVRRYVEWTPAIGVELARPPP